MLEPQAQRFLDELAALGEPPIETLTPQEARASDKRTGAVEPVSGPDVERIENRTIAGPHGPIPLRIYVPVAGSGDLGVLVYFHGGGWVVGDLEAVDALARTLANRSGCIVVSVDYRLAPEHRFPVPFDDAYAATAWVAGHAADIGADPSRVAVGGDSAGGNLAAAVTLAARDRGGPRLVGQVLIYPVTDRDFSQPSYAAFGDGYFLTTRAMQWFWQHYVSEDEATNSYASPLRAAHLRDLPPAVVIIAGYDPLRDEGEAYARRLQADGVAVDLHVYAGMLHGFCTLGGFDRASDAIEVMAHALRTAFQAGGVIARGA